MTPAPDPRCRLGMERPPFQEDGRLLLGNASRGGLVAREVLVLRSRWQRMRLAWFRRLGPGQALLIGAPAVHSLYREVDDGSLTLDGVVLCATLGDELLAQGFLIRAGPP